MLTVSVKNFGPIAEGSVDLKPLTIFVGPSNTGKSYMATAVYAVMRAVSHFGLAKTRNTRMAGNAWAISSTVLDGDITEESLRSLQEWVREEIRYPGEQSTRLVESLPDEIRPWVESAFYSQLVYVMKSTVDNLRDIHGDMEGFVSKWSDNQGFRLFVRQDHPLVEFRMPLAGGFWIQPTVDIGKLRIPNKIVDLSLDSNFRYEESRLWEEIVGSLVNELSSYVLSDFPAHSYYLPASRSGIVRVEKPLTSSLIRQSSSASSQHLSFPVSIGVNAEFLADFVGLSSENRSADFGADLDEAIRFIESNVLGGEVDLDESSGLPRPDVTYETEVGRFTINQTSSMVSELAPLILFLKYLVRPGDLLILEEPESHLHPAAQLQMARGIARLVNAGVQVLITTHSGDFVGQINNLLRTSNASEKTARSFGLEQEDCLSPEQVSAYGFRIDADLGGAVTYPLPVGSDVGIEDEEFLPVAELLYQQALDLEDARLQ